MDLKKILTSQRVTTATRRRILESYIYPILQYGSEAWNINRKAADIINAAEMWFYRRALKILYADHITNEKVLGWEQSEAFLKTPESDRLNFSDI